MYDYPQYFLDVPDKVRFEFHLFLDKVYTVHIICSLLVFASWIPGKTGLNQQGIFKERNL